MRGILRIKSNGKLEVAIFGQEHQRGQGARIRFSIIYLSFKIISVASCCFLGDQMSHQGHPLSTEGDVADMSCRLFWASIN